MKKTILITSNAYFPNIGGVENSLKYLAQSYQQLGYQVIVVVSDVTTNGDELPFFENIDGISLYRYETFAKTSGIAKFFRPLRTALNAIKLLKKLNNEHDIILTLSRFHTTTVFANLAHLKNVTYLVPGVVKNQNNNANLVNNSGLAKLKLNLSRLMHHAIQKAAFKYCDQVVVFSQNMANQITAIQPTLAKLPILKPGVDQQRFCPIEDKLPLKIKYNIPTNKIILLTVGRFVRAKGFELVIDALKSLPQCHLVMVGDGENFAVTQQQIAQNEISEQVTLMGSQPDTAPFYQLADIFIMSSRYEPLGQTILEALSCALPVVAFRGESVITATEELLNDNEAVYSNLVSSNGLEKCINKLNDNPQFKEQLAQNSRQIAIARFSWQTLAQQIVALNNVS